MKILVKPEKKIEDIIEIEDITGLILPLKDYSINYETNYTIEEIKKIKKNTKKEIFVVINRMMFNKDIEPLKEVLKELETLKLTGIFFYDLSILQLKKELNLKTDLVWNGTHITTNYKTCDYYFQKGVKYAYLSNEITLKEVLEIKEKSQITPMFTLIGYPTVATSRRKLITNYNKMHNLENTKSLEIEEKITKEKYYVEENQFGTTFTYGRVLNNISALEKLKEIDFPYIILNEEKIKHDIFQKIIKIVTENLKNNTSLEPIYDLIGNNTGFLEKETIYKVKKDE